MDSPKDTTDGNVVYSKCEETGKIYAVYHSTDAGKVIQFVKGTSLPESRKNEIIDDLSKRVNEKGNYLFSSELAISAEDAFKSPAFEKTFGGRVELPSYRNECDCLDELSRYLQKLSNDIRKKEQKPQRTGTSLFYKPQWESLDDFFVNLKKYEVIKTNDENLRPFTEAHKRMRRCDRVSNAIQRALNTLHQIEEKLDQTDGQLELNDYQKTATRLMRLDALLDRCKDVDKYSEEFLADKVYQDHVMRYIGQKNPTEDIRKQNAHLN